MDHKIMGNHTHACKTHAYFSFSSLPAGVTTAGLAVEVAAAVDWALVESAEGVLRMRASSEEEETRGRVFLEKLPRFFEASSSASFSAARREAALECGVV